MKLLKRIRVKKLFGIYNYDIDFEEIPDLHVAIIDAPNGMGKTTILKMIQATVNADIIYLDSIPFYSFELFFNNNNTICVKKSDVYESMVNNEFSEVRNYYAHFSSKKLDEDDKYCNIVFSVNDKVYPVKLQIDPILMLGRRLPPQILRNRESLKGMSVNDFLSIENGIDNVFDIEELSDALGEIVNSNNIYYIKANRLYRHNPDDARDERLGRRTERADSVISAVELYRNKIKKRILSTGKVFADRSEELDRTFPQRVLESIFNKNDDVEMMDTLTISRALEELEIQRDNLQELGLVTGTGDTYVKIPKGRILSKETRIFLTNYIEDNILKLEVYKTLAEELRLLRTIVNNMNTFSDKTMQFNSDKGIVFVSKNGREIPIDKLSSGEKNNLVLFYELIFECGRNSLILIDEPEISLHVSWQRQFIDELKEICIMKGLQGLVATHSPDIVDKYEDLMIDLVNIDK